jgi:UDP-glucose:glycoprotein glucosyltransferase
LGGQDALKLLTSGNKQQQASSQAIEGLLDASDRQENGGLIIWLNDLEKDKIYAKWSPSIYAVCHQVLASVLLFANKKMMKLLQPNYGLPSIKRNVFNVVLAVDFKRPSSLNVLNSFANIIARGLPIHVGVIPIIETEECKQIFGMLPLVFINIQ